MDRLDFLKDEYENVERALSETLRYDYRPEQSLDFFEECKSRLLNIKNRINLTKNGDFPLIASTLDELSFISNWICLIERSHLGEFSWPFAEALREMANEILAEQDMFGQALNPIISIVSEGAGYRITYESQSPTPSSRRRFAFVVFPRSLKHHVLLHTVFAHELCHTALYATEAGAVLLRSVSHLIMQGPLSSLSALNTWLHSPAAPADLKQDLANYQSRVGSPFTLDNNNYQSWIVEFLCDVFGLLLFGPSFMPSHRIVISSGQRKPFILSETHPFFESRYLMLVRLMRILGWDSCILSDVDGKAFRYEKEFLKNIMTVSFPTWADIFNDAQLRAAAYEITTYLNSKPHLGYRPGSQKVVKELITRIDRRTPPIFEQVESDGSATFDRTHIGQTMYCGWAYWFGQDHKSGLSFFDINRLCDQALLQQAAIDIVKHK